MRSATLCIGAAMLAMAGSTQAAECRGIAFPGSVLVAGQSLQLNGLGVRKATFLKINVYVAALYVAHPTHDAGALLGSNGPTRLVLHFVRGVGASDIRNAFAEGFQRSAGQAALAPRIARLQSWIEDMRTGGEMTFVYVPGAGVQVGINGAEKGTIAGEDFARALLEIWLGAQPPNPELKSGLLGGACD